jgi:transglutaminase-like putative cysteine protease
VYAPDVRRFWKSLPFALIGFGIVALCWQLPVIRIVPATTFVSASFALSSAASATPSHSLDLTATFQPSSLPVLLITPHYDAVHPYWQSVIFDRFDGHSWTLSEGIQRSIPAGDLLLPSMLARLNATTTATVQVLQPTETLVSPGVPVAASLDAIVSYAAGGIQPLQLSTYHTLATNSDYSIEGAPTFNVPLDLTQRDLYSQLPAEPERVRRLALALTRGRSGTLSQAAAISWFLRDSGRFQYDVTAASPVDQDAVDSFLFQSHRGYCSQFATAFAVLAREAGLPARVISGYDSGTQLQNGSFLVRARDAHSWDQIYVDGEGWITVDPTPGFSAAGTGGQGASPAVTRSGRSPGPVLSSPRSRVGPHTKAGSAPVGHVSIHRVWPASGIFLLGGGTVLLILLLGTAYALRPRPISQLYPTLARGSHPSETPLEFASRFRGTRHYADIRFLADLYVAEQYARPPLDAKLTKTAWKVWLKVKVSQLLWLVP